MDNNQNNNKKTNKQGWMVVLLTTIITGFLVFGLMDLVGNTTEKEISYNEFLQMVDEGKVEEVRIGSNQLVITPKQEETNQNFLFPGTKVTYYTGLVEDEDLADQLYKAGVKFGSEIPDTASALFWNFMLTVVVPFILIFVFMSALMKKMSKGGGMMGIGKSNAKVYVEKQTGVTFKDVAGQDEEVQSKRRKHH